MIIIHHLNNSRSHRVIWLLEELGVEYEIKHYKRDPKTMLAPPSMLAVHPLGTSPIITDGDVVLTESGAIIEYILYKYGNDRLKPILGTPEWIQYVFWLHFAEGSLQPLSLLRGIFSVIHKTSHYQSHTRKNV
jgi:glutathione S-transferase